MEGFLSRPEPCPYLPGRGHRCFLPLAMDEALADYRRLLDRCFRRSGALLYRPRCEGCGACRPIRVPVARFRPRRDQRRCRRRNVDLSVLRTERGLDDERFALYRRYQKAVHGEESDPASARAFLVDAGGVPGGELHLRDRTGTLVGVSVYDRFPDALSSVYAYYDPECSRRSLGTRLVLAEIDLARDTGRTWLYLGFMVRDCPRMAYKARFRPHQVLEGDGHWVDYA